MKGKTEFLSYFDYKFCILKLIFNQPMILLLILDQFRMFGLDCINLTDFGGKDIILN